MDEDDRDRIDLSALDPARDDEAGWRAKADAIAARALRARRRQSVDASPVAVQLLAWARPALALAAGLALVVWTAALAAGLSARSNVTTTATRMEPAVALSEWAMQDELPSTDDVLQVLGGDHAEP